MTSTNPSKGAAPSERSSIDDIIDRYKQDVDRSLLRENLRRSVEARIRMASDLANAAEELRRAGQRVRQ
jgi:hypothetical protein